MSEYASETVVVPTHVDWCDDLRNLVEKIVKQDGENLNLDALCQNQSVAINHLMRLVLSIDLLFESCELENEAAKQRLFVVNFKNCHNDTQEALAELGMRLPSLYSDVIKAQSNA